MNQRIDWQGWLKSAQGVAWLAFALGLFGLMVQSDLLVIWSQSEEYGHGLMVVAVLAYLVARRWGFYRPVGPGHGAASLLLAILSLCLVVLGEASGIALMGYYGIWLFGLAAVWAAGGIGFVRKLAVPFLIVPLLFPLPNPLGPLLTAELQLISSKLGVWLIRLFGGSVYLEGNVLDMGGAKLLVAEACAGLRYLFPLMSLGAIAGYVLRVPLWMRWAVFLVTIPITIFMNSFRIAVTGLLSESGGTAHTDGFLHFFEGWVVFIAASLLLLAVTSVLVKLLPGRQRLFDVLALPDEAAVAAPSAAGVAYRTPVAMIWTITGLMLAAAAVAGVLAVREERMPERVSLNAFPLQIAGWTARMGRLSVEVENVAGASEYFYGDYSADGPGVVNVYVAYYETQRHGRIPHSPKVCIPGGGWVIESQGTVTITGQAGESLEVNRLVTGLGGRKVISYYWLKQGPRVYRQEFLARLDLVRFSLLENRTDGALLRLVTEVMPGETLDAGDARLHRFAADFIGRIPAHVPD